MRLKHIQRLPFPGFLAGLSPAFREVDPGAILAVTTRLMRELLARVPHCQGIVISSQMHSLVLTNEQGTPLSNCISWQDQRALQSHHSGKGTYFDVLLGKIEPAERRETGNELWPGLPICSLFWMAETKRLPQRAIPASLPDFILANLCRVRPGIERTLAAAHGALNLETLDWHRPLIARLGLECLQWPAVRSAGEIVGMLDTISGPVPCYTPVGDHQCALVGACLEPEELSINIATGSQVSLLTTQRQYGDYQTRPFFEDQYVNTVTHIPAGRSLDVLVKLLTEMAESQGIGLPDYWAYITRAVSETQETDLRVNLAFFRSVCGDQGSFSNIRENNLSVGHVFRAAFENMANNYYECALRLSPARAWKSLVFSGGLAQKLSALREIIAQKFQVGYRVSPSSEDTLLGLLVLACVFTEEAKTLGQATERIRRSHMRSVATI